MRLKEANLKVNAKKSKFFATEIEYLGFWLTREGIRPVENKIKAILDLAVPETLKLLKHFLGMVNFYRDMWRGSLHMIAPLTELTSIKDKKKFQAQWTERNIQTFNFVKEALGRDVLLAYPDFSKPFHIYTNASDYQIGSVIT